jgi:hypothetical protein
MYFVLQSLGHAMHDLDDALSDIKALRSQLARSTPFRGYSASAFAATGLLAVGAAALQPWWLPHAATNPEGFVALWVVTALIAAAVIGADVIARSRRAHLGLANEMIYGALEQLLPAGVAGALLTYVILRFAPEVAWMLPGLWQMLLGVGVFAACRSLPAPLVVLGVWYLATGLVCLAVGHATPLTALAMGVPFGIGQFLAAGLIHKYGGGDGDE